tara:strand:- start:1573 stop:2091 length:519 start_codon:yes stop_codon:yes gene_type:complete
MHAHYGNVRLIRIKLESIFRIISLLIGFSILAVCSFSGYLYLYPGQELVDGLVAPLLAISIVSTLISIFYVRKAQSSKEGRIQLGTEFRYIYNVSSYSTHIILAGGASFWWLNIDQGAGLVFAKIALFFLYILTFIEFPNKRMGIFKDRVFMRFSFPLLIISSLSFVFGFYK